MANQPKKQQLKKFRFTLSCWELWQDIRMILTGSSALCCMDLNSSLAGILPSANLLFTVKETVSLRSQIQAGLNNSSKDKWCMQTVHM